MNGTPPTVREVLEDLRRVLGADRVLDDETSRREYSMDASPCLVPPAAAVRPRSEDEVVRVLRTASAHGMPVTPRAAGTSLSGAAIGPGIVLDTSRLDAILDFRPAEGWVRVQPGVSLLDLNAYLAPRGFRFPIEPGSREWCRIGGMIGHNASGYQSVKYGQMSGHVLSLRAVTVDGRVVEGGELPLDGPAWQEAVANVPALEVVRGILEDHREAILASRRPVRKHACGYGLARLVESLDRGTFPLAGLFVGSEGTLGVVTEATLRVRPLPPRTITALLLLDAMDEMGPLVRDLLPFGPSAIEGIDGDSLDVLGREAHGIPPETRALVLVEFDAGDFEAISERLVRDVAPRYRLSRPPEVAADAARQAELWKARRSLFPTLLRRAGARRPWGFVEDPIVPVDRVTEFLRFLAELTRKYGTVAGIYGHLGDGNTHYRPVFDPTEPEDLERMRALRNEFDDALLGRFQGAPSGEHGIGRIRADILPRVWGPEVYAAMRAIKAALDPRDLLNPGVMFSSAEWWETWGGLEDRQPL
jgi:FAD/FMN-containing dehydrogenase